MARVQPAGYECAFSALAFVFLSAAIPAGRITSSRGASMRPRSIPGRFIDQYAAGKKKAPQTLQDLVDAGNFREIPLDRITGTNTLGKRSSIPPSVLPTRPRRELPMCAAVP
jgi:hypothetical protein